MSLTMDEKETASGHRPPCRFLISKCVASSVRTHNTRNSYVVAKIVLKCLICLKVFFSRGIITYHKARSMPICESLDELGMMGRYIPRHRTC
jgi:hypothetical protein